MAMELIRFLAGISILLIPGICLARYFLLGENFLERFAIGGCLGLGLAVYLASAACLFDLRWFYPFWGAIGLACIGLWITSLGRRAANFDSGVQIWMVLVLVLVGLSRFAVALPVQLPPGGLDPKFHLILAGKIQLTHHAIDDWMPFADVKLNYPTGSHVLVVVLAAFSGLPLHTAFKDLIPFLGVLTTAQLYVFFRRASNNSTLALYSAAIYGLWAWWGSIDYFRWGGLPNELAMLLFVAMLSIWLDRPGRAGFIVMAVLYASAVLAHHHLMVVSGGILSAIVLWQIFHDKNRSSWKWLAGPVIAAGLLDAFFLIPYAMRVTSLHSTAMASDSERVQPLYAFGDGFGYLIIPFAIVGIVLCVRRKAVCHSVIGIASFVLAGMFIVGEDIFPMALGALHRTPFTLFTPSRFLADLNYFLPFFVAVAVVFLQKRLRIPSWIAVLFIFVGSAANLPQWTRLVGLPVISAADIRACDWIKHNTPANAIVDTEQNWVNYLCWRRSVDIKLPVSEPTANFHPLIERVPLILAGKIPPESADLLIVAIRDKSNYHDEPILWKDQESGVMVVREWPK